MRKTAIRIFSLLLCLALWAGMLPAPALAAEDAEDLIVLEELVPEAEEAPLDLREDAVLRSGDEEIPELPAEGTAAEALAPETALSPAEAEEAPADTPEEDLVILNDGEDSTEGLAPLSAEAELQAASKASGMCGEKVYWTLYDDGRLLISGTGAMYDYRNADAPWVDYRFEITQVSLSEGVTYIGAYAFSECSEITSVTIPASVTSMGRMPFADTYSLTEFRVSANNPSFCTDSLGILYNKNKTELICSPGTVGGDLTIPAGVQIIGDGAFISNWNLTSVTIPASVTTIGDYAFCNCGALTSVSIAAGVSSIGHWALCNCYALTSISVNSANPWFSSDSRGVLFDKNKTTLIQAPAGISGSYTVPSTVTEIGNSAFHYCQQMTNLVIPNGVTSIGQEAAYGCNKLTAVTIPQSVADIDSSSFGRCSNLTAVNVSKDNPYYSSDAQGGLYDKNKQTLLMIPGGYTGDYVVPEGVTLVEAAYGCNKLTGVTFPVSLETIEWSAFWDCSALTMIVFQGPFPEVGEGAFSEVTATAYYPTGDPSWTTAARNSVEGNLTWVAATSTLSGWEQRGECWYYYADGKPVTGWKKLGSVWYWFDETGIMATGWRSIGGKWYFFDESGHMAVGWRQINWQWYYFDADGAMAVGWRQLNGKWYYFNSSGDMAGGWKQLNGKWYYFGNDGIMTVGWRQIGGKRYYFRQDGAMAVGWQSIGGRWYYFTEDSVLLTGWQKLSGKWYYFESSGAMVTGWKEIAGKWYWFESTGAMVTGWRQLNGKWYFFESTGAMAVGWKYSGGKWYYLDSSGAMLVNTSRTINGKTYYFDGNGVCMNP